MVGTPEAESEQRDPSRSEASVQAFRDALGKSVTISLERLQEIVDDAVRRGRMTRKDAEDLVGRVVTRGREQVDDLLNQIEPLISQTARRAVDTADQPLAHADRLRRRAGLPGFPITAYDQLSVPQINNRLLELTREQLLKVREYERDNRNRVGVLRAVERRLDRSS